MEPPDIRKPTCVLSLTVFQNIRDEQWHDPYLRYLILWLTSETPFPSLHMFGLQDGILYCYNKHPDGPGLLLVTGHLGVSRTYENV